MSSLELKVILYSSSPLAVRVDRFDRGCHAEPGRIVDTRTQKGVIRTDRAVQLQLGIRNVPL